MTTTYPKAAIEAHPTLPIITIIRDFRATPAQLIRAHTDADVFARWIGPDSLTTRVDRWDARRGGEFRYTCLRGEEAYRFYGSFHDVRDDRLVQTFTFEGEPDVVALETMWFEDLGDGQTRLHARSLVDSIEARDAFLRSGMETGINEGYAKLDRLLADGSV